MAVIDLAKEDQKRLAILFIELQAKAKEIAAILEVTLKNNDISSADWKLIDLKILELKNYAQSQMDRWESFIFSVHLDRELNDGDIIAFNRKHEPMIDFEEQVK